MINFPAVISFLNQRKYTSQFLISALHSAKIIDKLLNENKLFIIQENNLINFLAYVSSTQILHVQGVFGEQYQDPLILFLAHQEIVGINGPSSIVHDVIKNCLDRELIQKIHDDTVFSLSLPALSKNESSGILLREEDFAAWLKLYVPYLEEMEIRSTVSMEERFLKFKTDVHNQYHWGFRDTSGRLAAIASFNAVNNDVAQIGGVYTLPELRGQGFAAQVMQKLVTDSTSVHHFKELILFTGPVDSPPYRLYLKLGFIPKDQFTLVILRS
jgi:GNAT superfamily N-acetyltransferase